MPVATPAATVPKQKIYSHAEILEKLTPFATRGWVRRFIMVETSGQKNWLSVVRSFNISTPEIEYIIEDIVRGLEPAPKNRSVVRAEMEALTAEGKLNIDTPEKEKYWQDRLDEESANTASWRNEDTLARHIQRQHDWKQVAKVKLRDNGRTHTPLKNQDPAHNPALATTDPVFTSKPVPTDPPALPKPAATAMAPSAQAIPVDKNTNHPPDIGNQVDPSAEAMKEAEEEQVATSARKAFIKPNPVPPESPVAETQHPTELTEAEKAQQAFVPKPNPNPNKEPPAPKTTVKSITDGESGVEVFNATETPKIQQKIETIEGLNEEACTRLKAMGISTVAAFEKMDIGQARATLGMPVFQSLQHRFKT